MTMKVMKDPGGKESTPAHVQDAAGQAAPPAPAKELALTKFLDPLRIPPVISIATGKPRASLKISMRRAEVKLHSQLPSTPVWTYNGSLPGPTIEVRSGQNVHVTWENAITGSYPVV